MTDIMKLKKKITALLNNDIYDTSDLKTLLDPMDSYFGNPVFIANLTDIVKTIIEDRNGDKNITMKDIKLLGKDFMAILSIIKGLLLIVNAIPDLKIKYDADATEELIFKILVYIFLVIVPKETNLKWTKKDKIDIIDVTMVIYDSIKSSHVTKDILAKIAIWFGKNKGKIWDGIKYVLTCKWCKSKKTPEAVVKEHLPLIKIHIRMYMGNVRDKRIMTEKLKILEKKLNKK